MKRIQDNKSGRGASELQAVTFDVAHTLIHSPKMANIYNEVLGRHGIKVSIAALRKEVSWVWKELSCQTSPVKDRFSLHPKGAKGWWHQFLTRLCQRLELSPPTQFASAELFDRFAHAHAWELYSDVRPALAMLKDKGLKLGIVSNWDSRLPALLSDLGLAELFEQITFSSQEHLEKPNPSIFLSCLSAMGVPPENALHVGDHPIDDFEGAQAAGMHAVLIDRKSPADLHLQHLLEPFFNKPLLSSVHPAPGTTPGGRNART